MNDLIQCNESASYVRMFGRTFWPVNLGAIPSTAGPRDRICTRSANIAEYGRLNRPLRPHWSLAAVVPMATEILQLHLVRPLAARMNRRVVHVRAIIPTETESR